MRRALLSVLLTSLVLAGAAGISGADQAEEAVSDLRADWIAAQSLPLSASRATAMGRLRIRARSLAHQYPENADVQTWVEVVISSQRDPRGGSA